MAWFLKLDGIKGESLQMADHLSVLAWNCEASLPTTYAGLTASQVAGQAELQDMHVTVAPDKAFVDILKFVCTGKPVAEAVLVGRKDVAGVSQQFFKMTLTDVYVSAAEVAGSWISETDAMQPCGLILSYLKMKAEYTEFKKNGTPGDKPKVSYDRGAHEVA
jgi:type VI secretion system secreted protein Hcp